MAYFFDDYEYKDISKRVEIKLIQSKEKVLSPWEISSFISNFNTYYYKAEVMNTIAIALNEGIDPKNIIIFDESFKLNHQYGALKSIECKTSKLQHLYTLGKPISIYPNEMVIFLYDLFSNVRRLNEYLYEVKKKPIAINTIHKYYNAFSELGKHGVIELLRNDVSIILHNVKDSSVHEKFHIIIESMHYKADELDKNWGELDDLIRMIEEGNFSSIKSTNKLYQLYFKKFYSMINAIPRPVIGVYDEKSHTVSILCRAHFNKNERNAVTLDLKSVSHNSPIKIDILGGLALLWATAGDEVRKKGLYELEKEKGLLQIEQEKLKLKQEQEKLYGIEEQNYNQNIASNLAHIEKLIEIKKLVNTNEVDAVQLISNPYIRHNIDAQLENVYNRTMYLMQRSNFDINTENISILDIKG